MSNQLERYLDFVCQRNEVLSTLPDIQEFRLAVFRSLPEASQRLMSHDWMSAPLEAIKTNIELLNVMFSIDESLGFSTVCNVLVLVDQALSQGYPEEHIFISLGGKGNPIL